MRDLLEYVMGILAEHMVLRYIANTCMAVSVSIVFLLLIRPWMKKLPRIGMYVLWITVVLRILCPFSVRGIYHVLPGQLEQKAAETNSSLRVERVVSRIEQAKRGNFGGTKNQYRLDSTKKAEESPKMDWETYIEMRKKPAQKTGAETAAAPQIKAEPEEIILFVWAAGVLFCIGGMMVSLGNTRRRYKDAKRCYENVYTHPLVSGSFVSGILSPRIYIDERFSEEERGYILCHERVHIRRRDYLIKPFAFMVFSLLWFNPLIWVAYHYLVKDMEISCDEKAIQTFPQEERKNYSYLLLSMAGGDGRLPNPNPAFSAGVVKERIQSVMHYKKPTACVSLLLAVVVILCSCGIASAPEETVQELPEKKQAETYVEQAYDIDAANDLDVDGYEVAYNEPVLEPEGKVMQLVQLTSESREEIRYMKVVFENGIWNPQSTEWLDRLLDERKGKNYEMTDYQYGADGELYITGEYMSINQIKLWSNRDKYMGDYYTVRQELLKVDEESGKITEIPLPQEYTKDAVPKEQAGDYHEKEIYAPQISVFADGNVLVASHQGHISGIYSGVTGERLVELENLSWNDYEVKTGDGFFAVMRSNSQTGKIEIQVTGEDGKAINTISTDIEGEPQSGEWVDCRIGVSENTILMANSKGIFEAEPESDSFTNMINADKDNLYYLAPDGYDIMKVIGKYEEDYVVWLFNRDASAGSGDDGKVCRYTRPY